MELHITVLKSLKMLLKDIKILQREKNRKTWVDESGWYGSTPWLHKNSVAVVKTTTL